MADVDGFRPRCCNAIFGPGGNSHCSSSALRVVPASQANSARIAVQQKNLRNFKFFFVPSPISRDLKHRAVTAAESNVAKLVGADLRLGWSELHV